MQKKGPQDHLQKPHPSTATSFSSEQKGTGSYSAGKRDDTSTTSTSWLAPTDKIRQYKQTIMEWQKYYTHPVQNKQAESYSPAYSDQTGQYTTETKKSGMAQVIKLIHRCMYVYIHIIIVWCTFRIFGRNVIFSNVEFISHSAYKPLICKPIIIKYLCIKSYMHMAKRNMLLP